ncbi:hypothetical protein E2C01_087353 [Portunus trituberculatus]|uniref:Uncharacterized protein n=1 Tax=Portunus trituberculatus TaxID=210409 RepID=A0A5B7JJ03_PORTR|nr:hypothetical protein [Portunus trituberculatus]
MEIRSSSVSKYNDMMTQSLNHKTLGHYKRESGQRRPLQIKILSPSITCAVPYLHDEHNSVLHNASLAKQVAGRGKTKQTHGAY